ncbi:MAG: hypothetical protein IT330_10780 [Anaerolineae bacterium]|nr:hypothetical protein [Anaerolineae bacterium]
MASGRSTQLTKQIGEYLVAAELGRRGFIATTFTGNVPDFDILAIDETGRAFAVQVKTIQGGAWQFDIRTFLHVEITDDTQIVKEKVASPYGDMICVFVKIGDQHKDEFYIFRWRELQDHFSANYKGGKRPRNPRSFHCAVWPKDLIRFKDNWSLISEKWFRNGSSEPDSSLEITRSGQN